MSCGVMYQSHYSYFPYQRNILDTHTKQSLSEQEVVHQGGSSRLVEAGGGGHRDSPTNHYNFPPSRHSSPSSFPPQGPIGGFPPPLLREHPPGSETGFHHAREAPRTGSETGFQQTGASLRTDELLDKVKGERDKDVDPGQHHAGGHAQRSAQYLSANCVIFTYYSGDITKAVDDHFSKALSQTTERDYVPMSARNLPASFWDASWVPALPPAPSSDLYSEYGDPWQSYMASMTGYSAHQMYTARSYSSLLLQSRREWVEQNYPSSPYNTMSGLEGGMQPSAKDLYWF